MTPSGKDIRDAVLAALAAGAGALVTPGLPFLGVPLAAVSLGWMTYRFGALAATIVACALGVAAAAVGRWPVALLVLPALLAAGPGAVWALKRWSALRVVAVLTLVLFAGAMAMDAATAAVAGTDLISAYRAEAASNGTLLLQSIQRSGNTDAGTAKELADQFTAMSLQLLPTVYLYLTGLAALIAVPQVSRIGKALGEDASALPELAVLDLTPHLVWPAIAGLGLLALAAYLRQPLGWAQAIGMNLLLMVRPLLFFQGLGDFAALYRKVGVTKTARGFGYAFLVFTEIVVPSVSVLGLVDLFANVRKLPRGGSGPAASAV